MFLLMLAILMPVIHQNMFPLNTILQGHHCYIVGLAVPKKIVIGLKKYKQARVFFFCFVFFNNHAQSQTFLQRWHSSLFCDTMQYIN